MLLDVGPREIIQNGKNGFLIEDRNIDLMIKKIDELLSNNVLRKELGEEAKCYSKKFISINIVNLWKYIFE